MPVAMESSAQVPKPAPPIPAISSQYPETGQTLDPESGPPSVMLRDGGGIHSTADWSEPRDVDHGQELRLKWWSRIMDWRMGGTLGKESRVPTRFPDSFSWIHFFGFFLYQGYGQGMSGVWSDSFLNVAGL